jgi:hypothetical protein
MDNNPGINGRRNRETLPDHLHACTADRFEKTCDIGSTAGGVNREACGVVLQQFGIFKGMQPLIHNFDEICDGSDPFEGCVKRLVMETERGNSKHYEKVHNGILILVGSGHILSENVTNNTKSNDFFYFDSLLT